MNGEKRSDLDIGILYVSLWNQVKNKVGINKIISRKEFFEILGRHYLVPKCLRDCVIREMEKRKLIEKNSRDEIKILECEYDLEKDANKFYEMLNLY